MAEVDFEVLVIGGGPAGLSAALYLARYKRSVGVFDACNGRSTWHQTNRNLLGFPQGIKARELREMGRQQLQEYEHVSFVDERVTRMARDGECFIAVTKSRAWTGRAVILCTGVSDYWPQFPGWQEYVGRSMFWCITCDGYSSRGMKLVGVGNTNDAAVTALQLTRFTDDVTIITNQRENAIGQEEQTRLVEGGVPLIHATIKTAPGTDRQLGPPTSAGR